jgi:hypothetical protein
MLLQAFPYFLLPFHLLVSLLILDHIRVLLEVRYTLRE